MKRRKGFMLRAAAAVFAVSLGVSGPVSSLAFGTALPVKVFASEEEEADREINPVPVAPENEEPSISEEEAAQRAKEEEERRQQEEAEQRQRDQELEAQRQAEEEAQRKAEEEARKQEEQRQAEEAKKQEEQKKAEEEAKQQEEQRKAEEEAKKQEEQRKAEEEQKKKEEEAKAPVYKLTASQANVSFHTTQGSDGVQTKNIAIKNEGNQTAQIAWSKVQTNDLFYFDMDGSSNLPSGDSLSCMIYFNAENAEPGNYNAALVFSDNNDPSHNSVSVKITATVDKKEEVKPESEDPTPSGSIKVTLYADPSDGGMVSGGGNIEKGKSATLNAVANNGYQFSGWYNGSTEVSRSANYVTSALSQDISYTAKFTKTRIKVRLSVDNDKRGWVDGDGTYNVGSDVRIRAEAKDGYSFDGWYQNGKRVSTSREWKLTNLQKDVSYEARFNGGRYEVSVSANPSHGGTVSGQGRYDKESTINLKATPKDGYRFKGWMLNNQIVSGSTEYQIRKLDRDMSFTALFESSNATTYTINSGLANQGGVIAPSGALSVEKGRSVTYTMVPSSGYKILAVAVDGTQVGAVSTYTFSNVTANHTIAVAFAPKENAVVPQTLDQILSTDDVQKLALQVASASSEGRTSIVAQGSDSKESRVTIVQEGSKSGNTIKPTTVVNKSADPDNNKEIAENGDDTAEEADQVPEQNLIGMDDADQIVEEEEEYDYDQAGGVLQMLDMTPQEALETIASGRDSDLMLAANAMGLLNFSISNAYPFAGSEDSNDSLQDNATLPNILEVISGNMTPDEKIAMLNGDTVYVNFNTMEATGVSNAAKSAMESLEGVVPAQYIDISVLKSAAEGIDVVKELGTPMKIVLGIPAELQQEGRKYVMLRYHDGRADILENESDSLDKIAFTTDSFSTYAFGYYTDQPASSAAARAGSGVGKTLALFGGIALALCALAAVLIRLLVFRKK
ncbi:MAG: InlB B-repeat-containing protein [Lachnospiraceae bacterium]|nr:InlB B-repeat-containing protein [Lachnospiraceae bacterium]